MPPAQTGKPLSLRWVGQGEVDRVADARYRCYGVARKDLEHFQSSIREEQRTEPDGYLLAERDGHAVGTATSLDLRMWVRGALLPCQGVAWVGAIKTSRRAGKAGEHGVASAVMHEALRHARERNYVLSALMPFRVSFYEHFGYGDCEKRVEWNIPLSILPRGDCSGWRFERETDLPAVVAVYQQQAQAGQGDIQRHPAQAPHFRRDKLSMDFVRQDDRGAIDVAASVVAETIEGKNQLRLLDWACLSPRAFESLLSWLGTLRDQHDRVALQAPGDWPVARLLREPQLPHRAVAHSVAGATLMSRLQVRILDHQKFLTSLKLPDSAKGGLTVAVHETEGNVSRFAMEIEGAKASIFPSNSSPDFECADRIWAAVAMGGLPATTAVRFGLATENRPGAARILDALADGPAPFCREAF